MVHVASLYMKVWYANFMFYILPEKTGNSFVQSELNWLYSYTKDKLFFSCRGNDRVVPIEFRFGFSNFTNVPTTSRNETVSFLEIVVHVHTVNREISIFSLKNAFCRYHSRQVHDLFYFGKSDAFELLHVVY